MKVDEANVENKLTAGADYIEIDLINQTDNTGRLGIDFTSVNGKAMKNVDIKDVKTDTGVEMTNLVSSNADIHVSNEIFNLNKTYILKKGDLSNTKLKFRMFGYDPVYSKDADIIAYFDPSINHKNSADISFTNEYEPDQQDYYPLTAKSDYKRMMNQYTVVQEYETLRLSYTDKIKDVDDDSSGKFDYRKLDNSKFFYFEPLVINDENGESINLDGVEIPVGVEFDSANGEIKSVGTYLKPQRAID